MGVPRARRQPAWWTQRRPYRPLSYHGAHRMFERVNASLGADWTLHDLRHSAASRMARDDQLSLTDVQWVMGHAHLTTTEIYLTPTRDEVIEGILAHHARQSRAEKASPPQHLVLALGRGRPPFLDGPGRELPAQLAVSRLRRSRSARRSRLIAGHVLHDGRHDGRPNSTDSDFGS